jgi:isopentenyl-diphosphate delta-isomerase
MISDNREITLVNKEDRVLGFKNVIAGHTNPVPLHRAVSVLIFNGDKILLQKRALNKPTWPGFWSNACCTHPLPGENYHAAAKRRLKEEMGFAVPLKEKFRFIYEAKYDKTWGENELDHVFVGKYEGKITPDPKEAAGYQWIDLVDLKKDIKKNPQRYTPWFKIILRKLKI